MRLSIITISYNNASGLKRTIESVIKQTCLDFEYIVIDGGSKDNSLEVIKEHDNYINKWVSEPDGGIYNAMNKGVSYAHGEYCLFVNSGDTLYDNNVINKLLQYEFTEDIVCCDEIFYGKHKYYCEAPEEIVFQRLFRKSLPHESSLIRTNLLRKKTYNEHYKIISDWTFFFDALILDNCSYKHLNFPITIFMMDGISSLNHEKEWSERKHYMLSILPNKFVLESLSREKKELDLYYNLYPFLQFFLRKQIVCFNIVIRIIRKLACYIPFYTPKI